MLRPFPLLQTWNEWCAALAIALGSLWTALKLVPKILAVSRKVYERLAAAATIGESLERIEKQAKDSCQKRDDGMCNIIDAQRWMMDIAEGHAFFECDARGHLVWSNAHWNRLTGLSQTESRGNGWENGIAPEDRARVLYEWLQSLDHERVFDSDVTYIDRTGHRTKMHVVSKPIRNGNHIIIGWRGVGTEIKP